MRPLSKRETRLQNDRHRHRELEDTRARLPLFEQPSVRERMLTFHEHIASLSHSECTTCHECFCGLRLRRQSSECICCSKDQHIPKLFSSANNMDPGPIPPQLQVRDSYIVYIFTFVLLCIYSCCYVMYYKIYNPCRV